ncbi:exopolysaccharide biosynthesis polyprenyl glycosylphosphotransferase [Phytoactinopolyspora limicola]|uniref:exopolysaccharide biosynthesis polyprenyl glycosylphosphotransferase n=1 Tax=Phytoactinopolyspora limicola TaxID=2715536 RepID=UPI00140AC9ED|nr:exopolysaccharide biosynthesis polyprenyl glycosylphosphotransferase [Phytoactinopolyspora limicola]
MVAKSVAAGAVWAVGGYVLLGLISGRGVPMTNHVWFAAFSAAVLAVALTVRQVVRRRLKALRRSGEAVCRTLAVGPGAQVSGLVDRLATDTEHPYVVVGACVEDGNPLVEDVPQVVRLSEAGAELHPVDDDTLVAAVLDAARQVGADTVCLAPGSQFSGHRLRVLSWALSEHSIGLVSELGTVDVTTRRLAIRRAGAATVLHVRTGRPSGLPNVLKSLVDRMAASVLLLMLLPVLVGVAIAVRRSGPGPVIFRQSRVGRGGHMFTMLKFRTMYADAETRRLELMEDADGDGLMFKIRDDPRITPVGRLLRKYSLDELPQLVNVVRGEMSLVGPRPPLPEEVAQYNATEARRLLVVPGMTGLWQVSGRSDLTWEETVRLDLRYVDNWSLGLDAHVLWRTGRAVARGSGAY